MESSAQPFPDEGGRILREIFQTSTAAPFEVVVPYLVTPQYAINILLGESKVDAQSGHADRVSFARKGYTARTVRGVLALEFERIDVLGTVDEEARRLGPTRQEAPPAELDREAGNIRPSPFQVPEVG